jgi:WhiB family redox-sensing transcriptional regulator
MSQYANNPPEDGLCKGHDTEMWFPVYNKSPKADERRKIKENTAKAVSICNICHIQSKCLDYSLAHEPYGIWGGLTEAQRAVVRSKRGVTLSREGRVFFAGVGLRSANGEHIKNGSSSDSE